MKLPPSDPDKPVAFATLMNLDKINENTFRSTTRAFQPGGPSTHGQEPPRAFGGHVYAQAVWAAARTLEGRADGGRGMIVHVGECPWASFVSRPIKED